MFKNALTIPDELRVLKQWICWKYEDVGAKKPTKVPYTIYHQRASVTEPLSWSTFDDAFNCYNMGNYDGVGFVFSEFDPYAFIDLDETTDPVSMERQLKIYREFDSYSEKSPSGKGLHIIVKGSIPQGRKRSSIEIYSSGRYATFTGDAYNEKPIVDRNDLLNQLYTQMAGAPNTRSIINEAQTEDDKSVIERGISASNGDKFAQLLSGDWNNLYSSQSEADLAFIDMVAFYTQNRDQISRIFKISGLGKRAKANRRDYVEWMINKSFDRLVPLIDFDGFKIALEEKLALDAASQQLELPMAVSANGKPEDFGSSDLGSIPNTASNNGSVAQRLEPSAHNGLVVGSNPTTSTIDPPSGLVGEIAQFIYQAAPRPVPEIALAGALGLMAGICGRAYNISGTGLNQYILLLAMTGAGKEAMASGIDKIVNAVSMSVPVAPEFIGPSEIASGQALIKYLSNSSQSFVSILGEFGLRLRSMSSEKANGAEIALRRMLLDLYNKSGHGQVARPSIYADKDKNTNLIQSPAFSILGESTPDRFYDILTEEMISEGLLPRFMIIEYNGDRPALNPNAMNAQPSLVLIEKVATLMANSKTVMANRKVINVEQTDRATKLLHDFDKLSDKKINSTERDTIRQLWNRAHMKVLKIAGLIAVGNNLFNPVVDEAEVLWAINIVQNDIVMLTKKFETGVIGKSSDEVKQVKEIRRMIKLFFTQDWSKLRIYCDSEILYNAKIIPYSYLNKRLSGLSAFKGDRLGPTNAIKRAIQILIDSDFMRLGSAREMTEKFGTVQKAYIVTNMSLIDDE